jgi:short-subunit dehydrogenase
LPVIGRNIQRLEAVSNECLALGAAGVKTAAIDVRARAALMDWIAAYDAAQPVDLFFANAGVTGGTTLDGTLEPSDVSYSLIEVNVLGVFNSVHAILPAMMARQRGHIALIGSLAGYVPLADSPSYCSSKAAVHMYGLALREALHKQGVAVSVVCPGFIETPMSNSLRAVKPFLMTAEEAADRIASGLAKNRATIAFPFLLALASRIGRCVPASLRRILTPGFQVNNVSH